MANSIVSFCVISFDQMLQILKDFDGILGALLGVVVGIVLAEVLTHRRSKSRIKGLKELIIDELKALKYQIPQKKDLIMKMMEALKKHELLGGDSVRFLDTGYRQHYAEIYKSLTLKQKNCLHVVYGILENCDHTMFKFEAEIRSALKDKAINEPFSAYAGRLQDYHERLKTAEELIDSYLKGEPIDVFYVESPLDSERRFT